MIFISGVHGVGKSFFCDRVKSELNLETYSASTLISERKHKPFSSDKLIPDIDANQQYLLSAVDELRARDNHFLLDGHFCLLNGEGIVTRIGIETFTSLKPDAIILMTEQPEIIAERRKSRDGLTYDVGDLRNFQNAEIAYAKEVTALLGVALKISKGRDDLDSTIVFVQNH